jgi:hypothetical protein
VAFPKGRSEQESKTCSNLAKTGSSAANLAAVGRSIITPGLESGGDVGVVVVVGGGDNNGCP